MSRKRKLLTKVLTGSHNLRFEEICRLAEAFGYRLDRVTGSHHIYEHPQSSRPLNLQNVGGKAKSYQVRQFLRDIEEFHLIMKE
jgi:predicted RNA binding protein YcfA (HicA-like mRNA interferase family)